MSFRSVTPTCFFALGASNFYVLTEVRMKALVWTFFAICVILYIGRVWIRWASMRKLVREDYLMFLALCLQLGTAIICQMRLGYVYMMEDVGNGLRAPPATFMEDVPKALRGLLAAQILTALALWGVKFNFLLFFYRIFCSASRVYRILWWTVVAFTIASFGVFMGVMSYTCTASNVTVILTECTEPHMIRLEWIEVQTSSAIDATNDLLSMIHHTGHVFLSTRFLSHTLCFHLRSSLS